MVQTDHIPLSVKQMKVEEELTKLRKQDDGGSREGLQLQEVNTMDAVDMKAKASLRVARARIAKNRFIAGRGQSAVEEATAAAEPISVAVPSTLTRAAPAPPPLLLGDEELAEHQRVYVKSDVALLRAHASGSDRTKELYCGERGRVAKVYPLLPSTEVGADVRFPDGEIRFFPLPLLERQPSTSHGHKPARKLAAAPKPRPKDNPPADPEKQPAKPAEAPASPLPLPLPLPAAAPKPAAPLKPSSSFAGASTRPEPLARQQARNRSKSAAVPSVSSPVVVASAAAPLPRTPTAPAGAGAQQQQQAAAAPTAAAAPLKVGQRILMALGGKTMPATVQYLGATEFADGQWVGLELATPDGKNDGSVAGKSYFTCKEDHGLFRRANEVFANNAPKGSPSKKAGEGSTPQKATSKVARTPLIPRMPPACTKTVRLWENGQYGSVVDTVPYKSMVIRPVHKTLKSILTTATRELGWHTLKRPVEVLFTETGAAISELSEVADGDNLIASWGELFKAPPGPLPRAKPLAQAASTAAEAGPSGGGSGNVAGAGPAEAALSTPVRQKAVMRNKSPMVHARSGAAAAAGTNKTVKVFENGAYGSQWSDTVPCYMMTVRSAFKTMSSVKTMVARELKWHQCSRRVEMLYNTLGKELTDVSDISDGDILIASAGDDFIKPHKDVADRFPPPRNKHADPCATTGLAPEELGPAQPQDAADAAAAAASPAAKRGFLLRKKQPPPPAATAASPQQQQQQQQQASQPLPARPLLGSGAAEDGGRAKAEQRPAAEASKQVRVRAAADTGREDALSGACAKPRARGADVVAANLELSEEELACERKALLLDEEDEVAPHRKREPASQPSNQDRIKQLMAEIAELEGRQK
ncbi:Dynactin subunit 1 [Diplonema papillatum]|nr:Dynactin subunit 1 [Diplonema papillatum]